MDNEDSKKELLQFLEHCRENTKYANQRIDYLLVGLSASGIVLLLAIVKDFKVNLPANKGVVAAAIISFVVCIVLNFLSQIFSLYSNQGEIKITKSKLKDIEDGRTGDYSKSERRIDNLEKCVRLLNIVCTILVLIGIIASLIFWAAVVL